MARTAAFGRTAGMILLVFSFNVTREVPSSLDLAPFLLPFFSFSFSLSGVRIASPRIIVGVLGDEIGERVMAYIRMSW